jgi:hypothetical protein
VNFDHHCLFQIENVVTAKEVDASRATKRKSSAAVPVTFIQQSVEEKLPIEDSSIDTVVMTWTSVLNPESCNCQTGNET